MHLIFIKEETSVDFWDNLFQEQGRGLSGNRPAKMKEMVESNDDQVYGRNRRQNGNRPDLQRKLEVCISGDYSAKLSGKYFGRNIWAKGMENSCWLPL